MRSLAMSISLYACETWAITADIERRIQALDMRCFCKLLPIWHRDHITNEKVKARTGNAIEPYQTPLTSVKRRKLKWYDHLYWRRLSYREQTGKDGKTTSKSGLALNAISYHGKLRAERSEEG